MNAAIVSHRLSFLPSSVRTIYGEMRVNSKRGVIGLTCRFVGGVNLSECTHGRWKLNVLGA